VTTPRLRPSQPLVVRDERESKGREGCRMQLLAYARRTYPLDQPNLTKLDCIKES